MGFVHDSEHDSPFVFIFLSELSPDACELLVRWASLANDLPIPTPVVVDVEYAMGAAAQTGLHQKIVQREVTLVKASSYFMVD